MGKDFYTEPGSKRSKLEEDHHVIADAVHINDDLRGERFLQRLPEKQS